MRPLATIAALTICATMAGAETDFTNLTDQERAAFHAEIREVLFANPDLLDLNASPPSLYQEDISNDLELIGKWSGSLFATGLPGIGTMNADQRIALFIGPDCSACERARQELEALSAEHNLRVTLLDAESHADLAQAMRVDTLPFYVFPRMMLRGHMPKPVLKRYLTNRTGQ